MTVIGAVAFGDFKYQTYNVIGLIISLLGSCSYTYDKIKGQLAAAASGGVQNKPIVSSA